MSDVQVPSGKYCVIVVGARTIPLSSGSIIVVLELAITIGLHEGRHLEKRMLISGEDSGILTAKSRFFRLGGELHDLTTVDEDSKGLIGSQLLISLSYTDSLQPKVMVHEYIGRGNPEKYSNME